MLLHSITGAGAAKNMQNSTDLSDVDLLALDLDSKIKILQMIAGEMLKLRVEYSKLSGRTNEIKANLSVLKEVKSALQSAIKAEQIL